MTKIDQLINCLTYYGFTSEYEKHPDYDRTGDSWETIMAKGPDETELTLGALNSNWSIEEFSVGPVGGTWKNLRNDLAILGVGCTEIPPDICE